uniref:Decapping nuclease n=1 Tax=Steinernema glaseri TaxID=37863 RepID=A0A1I7YXX6_9BILA
MSPMTFKEKYLTGFMRIGCGIVFVEGDRYVSEAEGGDRYMTEDGALINEDAMINCFPENFLLNKIDGHGNLLDELKDVADIARRATLFDHADINEHKAKLGTYLLIKKWRIFQMECCTELKGGDGYMTEDGALINEDAMIECFPDNFLLNKIDGHGKLLDTFKEFDGTAKRIFINGDDYKYPSERPPIAYDHTTLNFAYDHTTLNIRELVKSRKSSSVGPEMDEYMNKKKIFLFEADPLLVDRNKSWIKPEPSGILQLIDRSRQLISAAPSSGDPRGADVHRGVPSLFVRSTCSRIRFAVFFRGSARFTCALSFLTAGPEASFEETLESQWLQWFMGRRKTCFWHEELGDGTRSAVVSGTVRCTLLFPVCRAFINVQLWEMRDSANLSSAFLSCSCWKDENLKLKFSRLNLALLGFSSISMQSQTMGFSERKHLEGIGERLQENRRASPFTCF